MLRAVTLLRKLRRLQTGRMRSSRMRLPAFGAFGRMSEAGDSRSSFTQVVAVAPTMPSIKSTIAATA